MRAEFLFLAFISLLMLSPVFADNSIGGSIDRTHAQINRGDLGEFEISVFSLKDGVTDVSVSAGSVDDLQVNVIPHTLTVQGGTTTYPTAGQKWVIIDGDKYARAYPVAIYVRVPQRVSRNTYSIPVTVSTIISEGSGSGNVVVQKVVQALQYNIEVDVPGSIEVTTNASASSGQDKVTAVPKDAPSYNIPVLSQATNTISNFLNSHNITSPFSTPDNTQVNDTKDEAKSVPSGYLILNDGSKSSFSYLLILGFIVLVVLVIYLLKK